MVSLARTQNARHRSRDSCQFGVCSWTGALTQFFRVKSGGLEQNGKGLGRSQADRSAFEYPSANGTFRAFSTRADCGKTHPEQRIAAAKKIEAVEFNFRLARRCQNRRCLGAFHPVR